MSSRRFLNIQGLRRVQRAAPCRSCGCFLDAHVSTLFLEAIVGSVVRGFLASSSRPGTEYFYWNLGAWITPTFCLVIALRAIDSSLAPLSRRCCVHPCRGIGATGYYDRSRTSRGEENTSIRYLSLASTRMMGTSSSLRFSINLCQISVCAVRALTAPRREAGR